MKRFEQTPESEVRWVRPEHRDVSRRKLGSENPSNGIEQVRQAITVSSARGKLKAAVGADEHHPFFGR